MKKSDNEMRTEYKLTGGTQNKFASRYAKGRNIVLIEPDIFLAFPSADEVNAALRLLIKAGAKATAPRAKRQLKRAS